MYDFESRRVIEALRSGIPSRAVGQYFSSARSKLIGDISRKLNDVSEHNKTDGMIILGKYGEGKTHLLNTVFNMAQSNNMVVSFVSLSKETPFHNLSLVYPKIVHNTYLPKRLQPGFSHVMQDITPNSPIAAEMLAYTAKHLKTDKLFYLFRAFLNTDNMDEKFLLLADLEGDFINSSLLRQIYKRIFNEKVSYNTTFSKMKHMDDYFAMLSHLFLQLGYNGWVLLFDETELVGRLGKKSRLNAYKNMASFLFPQQFSQMHNTFSVFALSASFQEDVIESKHEHENLAAALFEPNAQEAAEKTLHAINSAEQLHSLNKLEIAEVLQKLQEFHGRAYEWQPNFDINDVQKSTDSRGYLLRTRIRAAVEYLDQAYQYGQGGDISVENLTQGSYEETIPSLEGMV